MHVDFGRTAADYARHRAGFPEQLFERLAARGIGRAGQRSIQRLVTDLITTVQASQWAFSTHSAKDIRGAFWLLLRISHSSSFLHSFYCQLDNDFRGRLGKITLG